MKNFAHQWTDPFFQFPWLILGVALHFCFITGTVVVVFTSSSFLAAITTFSLFAGVFFFLVIIYYCSHRLVKIFIIASIYYFSYIITLSFRLDWAYNCISYLSQKVITARIILQIIFCHPPGSSWGTSVTAQPIRYL